jgi:integrase
MGLYCDLWERHIGPMLGDIELRKVTLEVVRRWRATLRSTTTPNRIAQAYRLLHAVMATAESDELITRNPCRIKGGGREHHPERPYVGPADVLALADAIEPRWRALVLLAGLVGLRRGELAALRWSDYDATRAVLRITRSARWVDGERTEGPPKTDSGRRFVPIPALVVEALVEHSAAGFGEAGPDGLVFIGEQGGPVRLATLYSAFGEARAAIGREDVHLHDLRHAALTMLAEEGATVRELMRAGGHASPAAALHYQRAADDRATDLAAGIDARARAAAASHSATVVPFRRPVPDGVPDGASLATTAATAEGR